MLFIISKNTFKLLYFVCRLEGHLKIISNIISLLTHITNYLKSNYVKIIISIILVYSTINYITTINLSD